MECFNTHVCHMKIELFKLTLIKWESDFNLGKLFMPRITIQTTYLKPIWS